MVSEGCIGLTPSSWWFCCSHSANAQDEVGPAAEAGVAVKSESPEAALMPQDEQRITGVLPGFSGRRSEQKLIPNPAGHRFLVCAQGPDYTKNKFLSFPHKECGFFAHKQGFKHSKIEHTFSLLAQLLHHPRKAGILLSLQSSLSLSQGMAEREEPSGHIILIPSAHVFIM